MRSVTSHCTWENEQRKEGWKEGRDEIRKGWGQEGMESGKNGVRKGWDQEGCDNKSIYTTKEIFHSRARIRT